MNNETFEELVLQSLEHEIGGVAIYTTAIDCAFNLSLKAEWSEYLEQTKNHVTILESVCGKLGMNPQRETPGRGVVRHVGRALVEAMKLAQKSGDAATTEIVACECVVLAETKDHADRQLLGKCAEQLEGQAGEALKQAYAEVEDQEDEHLYHTRGWCRELWIQSLGMPAVLPPPEEQQHVTTAIGAARAEQLGDKLRLEGQRQS